MNEYLAKVFILYVVIGAAAAAAATPTVTIDPASTTGLSPGDSFSVNIFVDPDGNGVSSGDIRLSFDTSVLEVTSLTKGDILGTNALDGGSSYDNTAGTVNTIYTRVGATTPPTAAGTWATVEFSVKTGAADGATNIIIITSAGIANEDFVDLTGITTTDGTFTVSSGSMHPTPAPTVTLASSSPGTTPDTTTTPAPPGEHVTPTPTTNPTAEPASTPATGGGATTPDAPAKKGLPGFEGAVAIAGLLAIACVMLRRK